MKKFFHTVFSPDVYKYILLAVCIANVCPLIGDHLAPLLKLFHLYAAGVIVFDLLGERRVLRNKGRALLAAFVLCYCVTLLCNRELISFSPLSYFAYMVEVLLLVYSYGEREEKRERCCAAILLALVTLTSIVAIWMFYTKYYQMPIPNSFIGMYPMENRLTGLFGNPNSLAIICLGAVCLSLAQGTDCTHRRDKAFYAVAGSINFIALLLSNSRTAIYSCVCMGALYVFLRVLRGERSVKRAALAVVAAVMAAAAGYYICVLAQMGLSLLDVNYPYYCEYILWEGDSLNTAGETIQRMAGDGFLNGRGYLWENGLKLFIQRPLFGYGLDNYEQSLLSMGVSEYWAAFSIHNSYLESLVCVGIAGTACAVAYLVVVAKNVLVCFRFGQCESWPRSACLFSCFAAFLVAALMESMLLGSLHPGAVFFWIIASKLMQSLEQENQASGHFRPEVLDVWIGKLKKQDKGSKS